MPHLVTNFLLAIKKKSGMGKTKYFVGSICSENKKKERDFVETSKEKSSMNYFMHSIICVPTTSTKKN